MKIKMRLDGVICTGTITRIDLLKVLFSMFLHFNRKDKWTYLKIRNIKGNPRYENWDYIFCHFDDIVFNERFSHNV